MSKSDGRGHIARVGTVPRLQMPTLPPCQLWARPQCPGCPGSCFLPHSPGSSQQASLHRKDESKEPIVEVRTEEERTPNHDGGKHVEPNETTPLTEPEYVAGMGWHPLGRATPFQPAHPSRASPIAPSPMPQARSLELSASERLAPLSPQREGVLGVFWAAVHALLGSLHTWEDPGPRPHARPRDGHGGKALTREAEL